MSTDGAGNKRPRSNEDPEQGDQYLQQLLTEQVGRGGVGSVSNFQSKLAEADIFTGETKNL